MQNNPKAGDEFIINHVHQLFRAKNDSEMFSQMVWISFLYTLTVLVSMLFFPAPYGRYSSNKFGFMLPGRISWIIQECPSCVVPIVLLFTTSSTCWQSPVNKILIVCYISHYINRSIIYPLTTRGAKPSPFGPFISAVIFCVFNGFMQSHYLLNYNCYDPQWLTSPNFIIGKPLYKFTCSNINLLIFNFRNGVIFYRNVYQHSIGSVTDSPAQSWRERIQDTDRRSVRLCFRSQFLGRNHRMVWFCSGLVEFCQFCVRILQCVFPKSQSVASS